MLRSLATLGSLESAATLRLQEQAAASARANKAQGHKDKLVKLRQKRDNLLQQLQTAASSSFSGELGNIAAGGDGGDEADGELRSAVAYLAELKEKMNVYKLTGVAITQTGHDGKVLCFTTSYKGAYLENYHVELRMLSSGHFKVIHHDLPSFVFSSCVADDLEVKDIPSLVQPVREVLTLYVMRREELKTAEARFSGVLHVVERSGPVDFVCCHLDVLPDLQIEITLKYKDLTSHLPSSMSAVPLRKGVTPGITHEGLPGDVEQKLAECFCASRLCEAVSAAREVLADHFGTNARQEENPEIPAADVQG